MSGRTLRQLELGLRAEEFSRPSAIAFSMERVWERDVRARRWRAKCGKRDAYPVVAFVEKLCAKPRGIAFLYVGRREGDKLLYARKARCGYTEAVTRDLGEPLDPLVHQRSQFPSR